MADHGVPLRDNTNRTLRKVWLEHHDKYFRDTTSRHAAFNPSLDTEKGD